MLEFVGSHYGELAAGAAVLFMIVLGFASVEDGVRRRHGR